MTKLENNKISLLSYSFLLVGLVAYSLLIFNTDDAESLVGNNASDSQLFWIRTLTILLTALIWIVLANAVIRIYQYSLRIVKSKESLAFFYLATGLGVLLINQVFATLISSLGQFVTQDTLNSALENSYVVASNYTTTVFTVIGYGFLLRGSNCLIRTLKKRPRIKSIGNLIVILISLLIGFAYIWYIFRNPYRTVSE